MPKCNVAWDQCSWLQTAWEYQSTGMAKMPHQLASQMLGTSSQYSDFQEMTKFNSQDISYLRPIFTKGVRVAGVRQAIECAYIHGDLQVTTEFHLLNGAHLELAMTDLCTTTGSRTAGIVNHHFTSHHQRQDFVYCFPRFQIASEDKNSTCGVQNICSW